MINEPTEFTGDAHVLTNWGRWGADDEKGALNFITDAARQRGVAEAREGRVVSMAFPLTPMPLAGAVPAVPNQTPGPVGQLMTFNGFEPHALTDVLLINVHHAQMTHIDALAHVVTDKKVYPGKHVGDALGYQTLRHGSTTAFSGGIVTRGVFLDLAPGGRLDAQMLVGAHDLEQAAQRAGVAVHSGDALVVRGGWDLRDDIFAPMPSMTAEAVEWMAEREISMYIGDIGDLPPVGPKHVMPMHQIALAQLGIPLIDSPNLSELAAACSELRRASFLLTVAALPVQGATGMPVNPLAIF